MTISSLEISLKKNQLIKYMHSNIATSYAMGSSAVLGKQN